MMKYKCQKCGRDQPDDMTKECRCIADDDCQARIAEGRKLDPVRVNYRVFVMSNSHGDICQFWAADNGPGKGEAYVAWTRHSGGVIISGQYPSGIGWSHCLMKGDTIKLSDLDKDVEKYLMSVIPPGKIRELVERKP